MKIVVYTLGCKVNQYESQQIIDTFNNLGYMATSSFEVADIYIINTCAVTHQAEKKSRQICRRAKTLNENASIFVFGCAIENYFKQTDNALFAGAIIITGCKNKEQIVKRILEMHKLDANLTFEYDIESITTKNIVTHNKSRTRSYVKIQDGCNQFCSYCIIPHLRGRSVSRPINEVINEIANISSLEIVLTGIDISSYGKDINSSLYELLSHINTEARVRLGSLECNVIDRPLLELMKSSRFCNHFHLSMQSASNNVLKNMNRKYSIEQFIEKVYLIRDVFGKNVSITTDIIVGYPTETDDDFLDTVNNLAKIKFSDMHIFRYSKREGTTASKLPVIDSVVINSRVSLIEQICKKYTDQFLQSQIGTTHNVYFETLDEDLYYSCSGYTENYCKTVVNNAPLDIVGTIRKVKICSVKDEVLLGQLL